MAFQNSGVNIDGLKNIQPLQFNASDISTNFLIDAPRVANELTGGWLGLIVSISMFIFLVVTLSDKSEYSRFRYTPLRATGIASCIVTMMGFVALSTGFFNNIYHMVIFAILTTICVIWVYIEER